MEDRRSNPVRVALMLTSHILPVLHARDHVYSLSYSSLTPYAVKVVIYCISLCVTVSHPADDCADNGTTGAMLLIYFLVERADSSFGSTIEIDGRLLLGE